MKDMNYDLISRSALLEEVNNTFDLFIAKAFFKARCDANKMKGAITRLLNDAPAVKFEHVEHSMWLEHTGVDARTHYWACLKCNTIGSPRWKRCPVCEAKMDAEVE